MLTAAFGLLIPWWVFALVALGILAAALLVVAAVRSDDRRRP